MRSSIQLLETGIILYKYDEVGITVTYNSYDLKYIYIPYKDPVQRLDWVSMLPRPTHNDCVYIGITSIYEIRIL